MENSAEFAGTLLAAKRSEICSKFGQKEMVNAKGKQCRAPGGGGGVLRKKLGRGVRPASQNPYPIYDQNLRFSLPYL